LKEINGNERRCVRVKVRRKRKVEEIEYKKCGEC
jgi:hypothetical protein